MRIVNLNIQNFRGVKNANLLLPNHVVFVGDNNIGKSTILEAIDLVLGPERLNRRPIVDEHDFFAGEYIDSEDNPLLIKIEVIVSDLAEEQLRRFRDHIEWWDSGINALISSPPPESTDNKNVSPALRVWFKGFYDTDEDDFSGKTYFSSPTNDTGGYDSFSTIDKRSCGFLYLRTLRTGSRALSLERGSLLDIILKLQEKKPQMWEDVLIKLRGIKVAEDPSIGISDILSIVQNSLKSYVPYDWVEVPSFRVSDLTRESLRKDLNVFMNTGAKKSDGTEHSAPYQHQGTGTINALVLSLLSIIADLKINVIFAMEEPEIAIPPYTQKSIVNKIRSLASQSIFTSHSPYILEEFQPEELIVLSRNTGCLTGIPAGYPPAVKIKTYRTEIRKRFCEALLARRVLIVEGKTEFDVYNTIARKLSESYPSEYSALETLGLALVNAETDSQVEPLGLYFQKFGKQVFAIFDKQSPENKLKIEIVIPNSFEAPEKGIEDVILNGTKAVALKRFALSIVSNGEWPEHLKDYKPRIEMGDEEIKKSLDKLLKGNKGSNTAADLLYQCDISEMPSYMVNTLGEIKRMIEGI